MIPSRISSQIHAEAPARTATGMGALPAGCPVIAEFTGPDARRLRVDGLANTERTDELGRRQPG